MCVCSAGSVSYLQKYFIDSKGPLNYFCSGSVFSVQYGWFQRTEAFLTFLFFSPFVKQVFVILTEENLMGALKRDAEEVHLSAKLAPLHLI